MKFQIKCRVCGCEWKYRPGKNGNYVYYYCNRCGKEERISLDLPQGLVVDLAACCGVCSCGGVFTMNNDRIICPCCGSINE